MHENCVLCLKNSFDILYLKTPLGVVGTSRDNVGKEHPVSKVTIQNGNLTLGIYFVSTVLRSHHPGSPSLISGFCSTSTNDITYHLRLLLALSV